MISVYYLIEASVIGMECLLSMREATGTPLLGSWTCLAKRAEALALTHEKLKMVPATRHEICSKNARLSADEPKSRDSPPRPLAAGALAADL
ncbi:hypothetical protein GCM10010985_25500 [Caballeronia grimmiae]|uniref:Uncharacterized protein n=1 Tax=Caballeronia grimmiae TaxID=1071679 RepID=A0ABQ1RGU6_9BURK|nr:hypothetical protein GCM10010985_25500 [Caballeronia grimmiae]